MSTKRYDPIERLDLGGSIHGEMEEYEDGDYVRFEDFDRLQKQLAEAESQRDAQKRHVEFYQDKVGEWMDAHRALSEKLSKPSPAFAAMRSVLRECETAGTVCLGGDADPGCPICNSYAEFPHEKYCRLAAALSLAETEHPAK